MRARLHAWGRALRRDARALRLATLDPRVPAAAKILAGMAVAYALSPVDLIPDFIPVLGQLDDLVIVPLMLWLAIRLVPADVWADLRQTADDLPPPE
jgi:uncharacterized membrane protein YkvA (DUF1232 family)